MTLNASKSFFKFHRSFFLTLISHLLTFPSHYVIGFLNFMVAGDGKIDSETITPLSSLEENFNSIPDNVTKIIARRKTTDNGQMLANSDGYMTAWFLYTLMNSEEASKVFSGDLPELLNNPNNWQDIVSNNIN